MGGIEIERLAVGPLQANCYIAACPTTRLAAVIDPGGDAGQIARRLESMKLKPLCVINTHAHPDHTAANAELKERYDLPIWIHKDEAWLLKQAGIMGKVIGLFFPPSPPPDRLLEGGEKLHIGDMELKVIHTPGHSPGGICLYYGGGGDTLPVLFSGDTLFRDSVGRVDLPGGSAGALLSSIRERIPALPDQTRVLPGHGPETTVGREKMHNPFLVGERL